MAGELEGGHRQSGIQSIGKGFINGSSQEIWDSHIDVSMCHNKREEQKISIRTYINNTLIALIS